jgi:hypothetical protein
MLNLFDPAAERELRGRIRRLDPMAPAKWGKLTAPAMVCHLIDSYRVALGEQPVKSKGAKLSFPPLRWLILSVLPFPKGAPTAPEYLTTKPAEWDRDIARLDDYVTRFLDFGRSPSPAWAFHPAFGQMNTHQWGILAYRHTAHHLTQFGA